MTSSALKAAAVAFWVRVRSPTDTRAFYDLSEDAQRGVCLAVAPMIRAFAEELSSEAVEHLVAQMPDQQTDHLHPKRTCATARAAYISATEKDLL